MTYALLRPDTAVAAAETLRGATDRAAVEGLIELLYNPPSARAALAAINALEATDAEIVVDVLLAALDSPHASVRAAAVQALGPRDGARTVRRFHQILLHDESWVVRRTALHTLFFTGKDVHGATLTLVRSILVAADDPHWRVRHALIQQLLLWRETADQRSWNEQVFLQLMSQRARVMALHDYLRYRWSNRQARPSRDYEPEDPWEWCPFWDWDAAVLVRKLERLGEAGRRQALDAMPRLLAHPDERVRAAAGDTLRRWGEPRHLAEVLGLLSEPRLGTVQPVSKLFGYFDLDLKEAVAKFIFQMRDPSAAQLAWAVDQIGEALPFETADDWLSAMERHAATGTVRVRCAQVRLASRWDCADAEKELRAFLADATPEVRLEAVRGLNRRPGATLDRETLRSLLHPDEPLLRVEAVRAALKQTPEHGLFEPLVEDPDARVRVALAECLLRHGEFADSLLLVCLQADVHPHVRAAALTPALAAELMRDPARETSWHVLAKASRLAKIPLWKIEPQPAWSPPPRTVIFELLQPRWADPPEPRLLGPNRLAVAPLGISGHYGLPVAGFVRAAEAGVNLLFWEPNYQTLTDFMARLTPADRDRLHLVAGTFEADGPRVRRDAERALKALRVERLAVFLMFWVQSWERIAPDVREALERLKAEGKVAAYGLSTHNRPLAIEAMEAGWDPVMVRHSAAHRGAEQRVFPRAAELGTSLLTFNNTCYGRLLLRHGAIEPPTAADCYRYALAQPGVRACWSAPATLEQLEENLSALRDPALPEDRRERLLAHGALVYEEDSMFRRLVRVL